MVESRAFLEPIKGKHPWMSYADLWTFAGCVAIEAMGGPVIPWKPGRECVYVIPLPY
jgi:cytochrome c peroxidase